MCAFLQRFVVLPTSYVMSASGIKLLLRSALIVILSVSWLPSVMLPSKSMLPLTFKFPVILVSPVVGEIITSPETVEIVFPDNTRFPVDTCVGSIIVVFGPFVKLIPVKELTSKLPPLNVTAPVS